MRFKWTKLERVIIGRKILRKCRKKSNGWKSNWQDKRKKIKNYFLNCRHRNKITKNYL